MGYIDAEQFSQLPARIQYRVMFNRRGNNVRTLNGSRPNHATNSEVVAFGSTRGKQNFARPRTQQIGHSLPRVLYGLERFSSAQVDRRWVAEVFRKVGQHRGENLRVHRRGSR